MVVADALKSAAHLDFLFGGLGTRETEGGDFISLIMFVPEYLEALIALGHRDAAARGDELLAFVDG